MNAGIQNTQFKFPNQTGHYKGKVRDVYFFDDKLIMVASDRLSAFDVVLPNAIPFKGQVLNQIAAHFLKATEDIVPNWILAIPDPNVSIGKKCDPFPVEMVIRGYLAGHAWRTYKTGKRMLCGVSLPDGLKENDRLPEPIITPTTKAAVGHDEDISKQDIIAQQLISLAQYEQLESYTRALFQRGTELAEKQGLILVDTKYEFGLFKGEITLIDEIHTPDSSRYFYLDSYQSHQAQNIAQRQLSKEFVRQWLIEHGFQGLEGQEIPLISPEFTQTISERYIELFEKITGEKFIRSAQKEVLNRVEQNVLTWIKTT
jgi:phosphoribosylaminoimidazole-succinocarboxamide synthase